MKTLLFSFLLILLTAFTGFESRIYNISSFGSAYAAPDSKAIGYKNRDDVNDVAKELRCPTCTGISVLESDAPFSNQIKDEVADQIAKGRSKGEILDYFVSSYGPWILRSPPMEGVNVLIWILPILLLTVGPFLVYVFVWRKRALPVGESGQQIRSAEEILAEMHAMLDQLKSSAGK